MGEASGEVIQQSPVIEQGEHEVISWGMVAPVQLKHNVEANMEQLSSDPQAQDHVGLIMDPILLDSEAHDGPTVKGHGSLSIQFNVGFEAGLSGDTIHPIYRVVDLALGQNQSETIWRLRFLALFSLVFHAIVGVPYLFGDFYGVHATYIVMLILTVVAIIVALISFFVSYWPISDSSSDRRSNLIIGLLIANFILLGGRRAAYWTLT